jgi:hypothetical protein
MGRESKMLATLGYVLCATIKDAGELAMIGLVIYAVYCIGKVNGWDSGG